MAGFAGVLHLDGAPLDPAADVVLDAMGAEIAHRSLATRRTIRSGPFGLVVAPPPGPARPRDSGDPRGAADLLLAYDGREAPPLAALHQAYGDRLPEHLIGPFALAIWDPRARTLLLARDRAGVRPLYTARVGDALLFGSEVKALLAHPDCPRDVDWLASLTATALPRRTQPRTSFFRGILPLEPGTSLSADARNGALHTGVHARTALPDPAELAGDTRTDAEIIAGYRDVLAAAVDDALGAEAEHTGLLLSGGIDSVSIAALATRRVRLPTFTVLGQSTFGNGDAGLAHRAATTLGLPVYPVLFRWEEPIGADAWRRLLWLTESPHCGPQHYYKFHLHHFARAVRPDLVRMLNGEGSDEYIGADFKNQGDATEGTYADYLADLAEKQREDLHDHDTLAVEAWMGRTVFSRAFLAGSSGRPLPTHPWARRLTYVGPGLEQDVLGRDDRLSAGVGLASDVPFLDPRLLDYVLHIPPRAWPGLFWKKHILREAMAGIVPDALRAAPKIPFFGGVDARFTSRLFYDLLAADDHALVRDALGGTSHPVLADGLVDTIVADLARDPQRGAALVLLELVNLGLLEKMAKDAAARPGPAAGIATLPAIESWDEGQIAAILAGDRPVIGPTAIPAFAPNVEVVRRDTRVGDPPSYIMVDDTLRYVLDGEETRLWREVLRRVDGARTLGSILSELDTPLGAVRKELEDALAFDVLVLTGG
jgi:asparagine synthase (glutamine-hydrolysing)